MFPHALDRRPRAPSGATRRGGLPLLSLQRPQAGPLLARRRRRQCARPLALCPPLRAGHRKGAAGKWTDAATGGHGDLLDLIRQNQRLADVHEAAEEARRFLSLPEPPAVPRSNAQAAQTDGARRLAARRLWAMTRPIAGTHAAAYPRRTRHHRPRRHKASLRFHPSCYHRSDDGTRGVFPAMIAAVTDEAFAVQGLHRSWLDPDRPIKALVPDPRRAMGMLLGHGVRIGFDPAAPPEVIAAGEGIETMFLRHGVPRMPAIAAPLRRPISAPSSCPRRAPPLYRHEADAAARHGLGRLADRARAERNRGRAAPSRPRRFQR